MFIVDTTFSDYLSHREIIVDVSHGQTMRASYTVWNKCEYYHCRKFATLYVGDLLCVNMVFIIDGMYYEHNATMG